jgi:mRNA interferase MazF
MPERGDLLLVPYPFSDLSATKRRPVLVLTTPDRYGDFIALPVTSRQQTEHGLPLAASDLASGCELDTHDRIVTLNISLVVKTVGRISERAVAAAVERFCAHIGFPKSK